MNTEKLKKQGITIKLSWLVVAIVLAVTNIVTVALWKPWNDTATSTRKITISGEAAIKSTPDEYVLSPYFEFQDSDKTKLTKQVSDKSTTITAKLKDLGVTDSQIKSSTNTYEKYGVSSVGPNETVDTTQLTYTVTVPNKDLAQKVQDYVMSEGAQGQLSPLAQFSESMRKELEAQAREKALEDAKSKADKTAKQLNAKVGKVVTFSEGVGYGGGPITMMSGAVAMDSRSAAPEVTSSVPVQPGEDEFRYSVSVEYELK